MKAVRKNRSHDNAASRRTKKGLFRIHGRSKNYSLIHGIPILLKERLRYSHRLNRFLGTQLQKLEAFRGHPVDRSWAEPQSLELPKRMIGVRAGLNLRTWTAIGTVQGVLGVDGYRLDPGMRLNALDWLNFFLADVRGGLGAYVNVFLLTKVHWSQAAIGAVLSTSGLIGIIAHPAVGAFIDRTRAKRTLIIAGTFVLSGCGLAIVWMPVLPVVLVSDIIMAVLGGVFAPTIAAITLGLCGRMALPARLGRNAAFDRAGNVFIAACLLY